MADLVLFTFQRSNWLTGKLIVRYTLVDNPTNVVISHKIFSKLEYTDPSRYGQSGEISFDTGFIVRTLPNGTTKELNFDTSKHTADRTKEFELLGTETITIQKTKAPQSLSFRPSGSMVVNNGYASMGAGDTKTITIPPIASYQVDYNANGGADAPASQTKWYGEALTLQAGKPTREGYGFTKWNTAADGSGTDYNPSGSYTANENATLYAQWQTNSKITIYDENGNPHTGFLKLYDDEGKLHDCIITLYDSQGNKKHIQ